MVKILNTTHCPVHRAMRLRSGSGKVFGRRYHHRSKYRPHQGPQECARRLEGLPRG